MQDFNTVLPPNFAMSTRFLSKSRTEFAVKKCKTTFFLKKNVYFITPFIAIQTHSLKITFYPSAFLWSAMWTSETDYFHRVSGVHIYKLEYPPGDFYVRRGRTFHSCLHYLYKSTSCFFDSFLYAVSYASLKKIIGFICIP